MKTFDELEVRELANALQGEQGKLGIRQARILHAALVGGPFFFALIIFLLAYGAELGATQDPDGDGGGMIGVLTGLHLLSLIGGLAVAQFAGNRMLSVRSLRSKLSTPISTPAGTIDDPSLIFLAVWRGGALLRLAALVFAAQFGLIVVLLASFDGALHEQPWYWVNAISLVVLTLVVAKTWPSAERVTQDFRIRKEEAEAYPR